MKALIELKVHTADWAMLIFVQQSAEKEKAGTAFLTLSVWPSFCAFFWLPINTSHCWANDCWNFASSLRMQKKGRDANRTHEREEQPSDKTNGKAQLDKGGYGQYMQSFQLLIQRERFHTPWLTEPFLLPLPHPTAPWSFIFFLFFPTKPHTPFLVDYLPWRNTLIGVQAESDFNLQGVFETDFQMA